LGRISIDAAVRAGPRMEKGIDGRQRSDAGGDVYSAVVGVEPESRGGIGSSALSLSISSSASAWGASRLPETFQNADGFSGDAPGAGQVALLQVHVGAGSPDHRLVKFFLVSVRPHPVRFQVLVGFKKEALVPDDHGNIQRIVKLAALNVRQHPVVSSQPVVDVRVDAGRLRVVEEKNRRCAGRDACPVGPKPP
jgi:hypothetical protein